MELDQILEDMDAVSYGKSRPKLNNTQTAFIDLKSGSLQSMRYSRAFMKKTKKKSNKAINKFV